MYSKKYIYPQTFQYFVNTKSSENSFYHLYSIVSKMGMSINCILLGDYSLRDTFAVNVCAINPIGTAQVNYNSLKLMISSILFGTRKKTRLENLILTVLTFGRLISLSMI
jgi:hypothetical protein